MNKEYEINTPPQIKVGCAECGVNDNYALYCVACAEKFVGGYKDSSWIGLTDEEMKKTWYEMQNIMGWYSFEEIAKAVEAKLKEKNTRRQE
jgi:hypothetical protein